MILNRLLETMPAATLTQSGLQLSPADVIAFEGGRLSVSLGIQTVEVELAILDYLPEVGDRLLVLGNEESGYFAIGVLQTVQPRPRLNVEISPTTGATVVSVEQGDLELIVPQGAVRILAGTNLEATSGGTMELQSQTAVRMTILDRVSRQLRRLALSRRSLDLQHERLEVQAETLICHSKQATVTGEDYQLQAQRLHATVDRAEVQLTTLLSQLGNVYQQVSGLWQLVADRTRMVVQGTSHHMARRIYSKADDVKVKAEKIHLG